MSYRYITLIIFISIILIPVISSGEINQHINSGNLSEEESAALTQLDSIFDNNISNLTLHRDSSGADLRQDATMKVMDIRKRWNEWSPAFKEIAGTYFLSKSSAVHSQSVSKMLTRSAISVRGSHILPNWIETTHFSIEWGNNLGEVDSGVNSDKILSCSGAFNNGVACAGIPDLIDRWADYFEEVWIEETVQLGYIRPAGTDTFLYDIYIANSGDNITGNSDDSTPALSINYLGLTVTYCDKDYFNICKEDNFNESYSYIVVNGSISYKQTMMATAAHEFFHAIQFTYPAIDGWWSSLDNHWWVEATATWMEEIVYDDVNHYYPRVQAWLRNPELSLKYSGNIYSGHEYGDALFIIYLTDVLLNNREFVRDVWEGDKSGIDALNDVLATDEYGNRDFEAAFKGFAALNAVADIGEAAGGYEEGKQYGRGAVTRKHGNYPVSSSISGNEAPQELGSNYIHFLPPNIDDNRLTIEFDGDDAANWSPMVLKVRSDGMGFEREDLRVDPSFKSGCHSIEGFGTVYSEIFLIASVLVDPDVMDTVPYKYNAALGDECTNETIQAYSVSQIDGAADTNNKDDKRCFIATVAFGSSDSPFVGILRDFRDQYLLTNRPGRVFVTMYYSISPSIAYFLEQHPPSPIIVRYALFPVIGMAFLLLNTTFLGKTVLAAFILTILSLTAYNALIKGYQSSVQIIKHSNN